MDWLHPSLVNRLNRNLSTCQSPHPTSARDHSSLFPFESVKHRRRENSQHPVLELMSWEEIYSRVFFSKNRQKEGVGTPDRGAWEELWARGEPRGGVAMFENKQTFKQREKPSKLWGILPTHVKSQILVHSKYTALGMILQQKQTAWNGIRVHSGKIGTPPGNTAPLADHREGFLIYVHTSGWKFTNQLTQGAGRQLPLACPCHNQCTFVLCEENGIKGELPQCPCPADHSLVLLCQGPCYREHCSLESSDSPVWEGGRPGLCNSCKVRLS